MLLSWNTRRNNVSAKWPLLGDRIISSLQAGALKKDGWVQIPSTLLGQVTQVLSSLFPYLEKWGDMELIEIIYINQYILTTK